MSNGKMYSCSTDLAAVGNGQVRYTQSFDGLEPLLKKPSSGRCKVKENLCGPSPLYGLKLKADRITE